MRAFDISRPAASPVRKANVSLRRRRVNTVTAATRMTMPRTPRATRDPLAPPVTATRPRARTGMPSFTKVFQIPPTARDTLLLERETPQEPSME